MNSSTLKLIIGIWKVIGQQRSIYWRANKHEGMYIFR